MSLTPTPPIGDWRGWTMTLGAGYQLPEVGTECFVRVCPISGGRPDESHTREMRVLYTGKGWRSPDGQCDLSDDLYVLAYRPTGETAAHVPRFLVIGGDRPR